MAQDDFVIDVEKDFPHLPNAPIVEAVMVWQATPTIDVPPESFSRAISTSFPEYETAQIHRFEATVAGAADGAQVRKQEPADATRLQKSANGKPQFVAQMKPDGVIFSRLAPYVDWNEFASEAGRFWACFAKTYQPETIARLSVRYISEISVGSLDEARKYLQAINEPTDVSGISVDQFFHQDTIQPGAHPYSMRVTRALQPGTVNSGRSLIIDIDVMTAEEIELEQMPDKLAELRFLKNAMFFGVMKDPETHFGATT